MAAATEVAAVTRKRIVMGDRKVTYARLTAPADGDTFATGLSTIENVQITYIGTTIAAADAVGVNSISGGTITLEVAGTARDIFVYAIGY